MTEELENFCRSCGPQVWTRVLMLCLDFKIKAVKDFAKVTETQVLRRRTVGRKTFYALKGRLAELGIAMIEEDPFSRGNNLSRIRPWNAHESRRGIRSMEAGNSFAAKT